MVREHELDIQIEAITLLCETCGMTILTVRGGTEVQAACEAAVAAHKQAEPSREHKIGGKIEGVA